MARRIVHQLVDDLDGSVLEIGDGETVLFSLDGVAYEIDMKNENASEMRESLAPYISAARRISSPNAAPVGKRKRSGQQDYSGIREWAKSNGFAVSERGRVPASIIEAYEAAH